MVVLSFLVDLSVCLSRTVMGSPNAFPGCSVHALLNQFFHHSFFIIVVEVKLKLWFGVSKDMNCRPIPLSKSYIW